MKLESPEETPKHREKRQTLDAGQRWETLKRITLKHQRWKFAKFPPIHHASKDTHQSVNNLKIRFHCFRMLWRALSHAGWFRHWEWDYCILAYTLHAVNVSLTCKVHNVTKCLLFLFKTWSSLKECLWLWKSEDIYPTFCFYLYWL